MKFNTVLVLMIFGSLFNLLGCKSEPKALPEQAQTAQAIADENLAGSTYAVTLDGKPLKELPEPDSIKTQNKAKLDASRNFYLGHLDDVKSYVSYGAQNLKCGYVENAIQVLSKGIEQFSNTADLYLYRGIAFVQGRQFGPAVNDFWKAGKAVEGQKDVKGMLEKQRSRKKSMQACIMKFTSGWDWHFNVKMIFQTLKKCLKSVVIFQLIQICIAWLIIGSIRPIADLAEYRMQKTY